VEQISRSTKYPHDLRQNLISGCVRAQFVVDTAGRAEMKSFHILMASHPGFAHAVRTGVATVHFRPAELHAHKVRQLVEQPFTFTIEPETEIPVESIGRRSQPSVPSSPLPPPLPSMCPKIDQ